MAEVAAEVMSGGDAVVLVSVSPRSDWSGDERERRRAGHVQ